MCRGRGHLRSFHAWILAKVFGTLAVLDKHEGSRSLEEEAGVDEGVATTEAEGSGRLGGHEVQCILRTRHECPGVITAAHE